MLYVEQHRLKFHKKLIKIHSGIIKRKKLEPFYYNENITVFGSKTDWGNCTYYYRFEIMDTAGNYIYTSFARARVDNLTMYVSAVDPGDR